MWCYFDTGTFGEVAFCALDFNRERLGRHTIADGDCSIEPQCLRDVEVDFMVIIEVELVPDFCFRESLPIGTWKLLGQNM